MGFFTNKEEVVDIHKTNKVFDWKGFKLTITENGYLEILNKSGDRLVSRCYLKHIDTVFYEGASEGGNKLQIVGKGFVLAIVYCTYQVLDIVQEWLIERIEEVKKIIAVRVESKFIKGATRTRK